MSAIVLGKMGRIYNRAVRTHKDEYMQQTFEQMCRDYLMKYADLPISITEVGRWWGTDRDSKKEVSIDIVGRSIDVDEYIVGSCLYDDRPAGIKDLVKLKYNAGVFGKGNKFHYYLFSRSGFTNELIECEMQGAVRLLTLRDLY